MDGETPTTPAPPTPLGGWWIAAVAVIGTMAALIAIGGMILSFRAVSQEMTPAFGTQWAWLVPVVIDLSVFVFSGVDLVLNRLRMNHPLARFTVYGATFGTVWLNYSAGGSVAGRTAHILMPSIWVVFVELMRHVVRRLTGLADGSLREPVPTVRWILAPWRTVNLWRRMVLWGTNSYPKALAQEKGRLAAIAVLRTEHGPFWRWRVAPLVRLQLSLGEPVQAPELAAAEPAEPDREAEPETPNLPAVPNRTTAAGRAERSAPRRTSPRPNGSGSVSPLMSRPERVEIIRQWIDQAGGLEAVPLSRIMTEFGCAKSTASGLRAEADPSPATQSATTPNEDDEADREDAA
jgi:hypothetical protein